ncbi:hypothetical protein C6341_g8318 [Phytophthora cactorum]|nr:hypothetical protein C6341_g8318 [Phytophthora cactorum]
MMMWTLLAVVWLLVANNKMKATEKEVAGIRSNLSKMHIEMHILRA